MPPALNKILTGKVSLMFHNQILKRDLVVKWLYEPKGILHF